MDRPLSIAVAEWSVSMNMRTPSLAQSMIGALLLAACRAEGDDTAALAPYTDCELAFDSDCDGDGAVGSEDCDDHDAGAAPGQAEVGGDGLDNDCDGRTDEVVVCAEGGDFATIAEGIDGTPDGGVLELCPGRYAEAIAADGRSITIEGGGEEPEDVVIDGTGLDRFVLTTQLSTDLTLRHFMAVAEGEILIHAVGSIAMEELSLCPSSKLRVALQEGLPGAQLRLVRVVSCAGTFVSVYTGSEGFYGLIAESLFSAGVAISHQSQGVFDVRNNLVRGDMRVSQLAQEDTSTYVYNNTIVDASQVSVELLRDDSEPAWTGQLSYSNNISVGDRSSAWIVEVTRFWDSPATCGEWLPTIESSIVWGFGLTTATCQSLPSVEGYDVESEPISGVLSELMTVDPGLEDVWWPESGSTVDAGLGADPDGTPADLGAFGGEHGEWWKEVSWLTR